MKKGFVLLETITVISIICVVLVALYAGYYKIINHVQTAVNYDNTEYIYKAKIVALKLHSIYDESSLSGENYVIYCNTQDSCTMASDVTIRLLSKKMNIRGIYITPWDTSNLVENNFDNAREIEPTTQRYIRHLDPKNIEDAYRIIVMFEDISKSTETKKVYEYASLRFVPEES